MKTPAYMIDAPTPYEPPEVWWVFLRRLRDLAPDDPAVQAARCQVLGYLVVETRHEPESG